MSPPWRDILGRISVAGDSQDFLLGFKGSFPGLGQGLPRFARNDKSGIFGLFTRPTRLNGGFGSPGPGSDKYLIRMIGELRGKAGSADLSVVVPYYSLALSFCITGRNKTPMEESSGHRKREAAAK